MRKPHSALLLTSVICSLPYTSVYASIVPNTPESSEQTTPSALGQVVVSTTKTAQSIDRVTASVSVITAEEIQKMGASSLKDIFQNTPGLTLQYGTFPSGSAASKSSVNLRGIGSTGTLWLVDGRRLAGEVKNPYDMDRIPASMIERIEIVKGPMSALYGADAVGGIINIITKQPKDGFTGTVSISGGANSHGDGSNAQLSANIQGGVDNFKGSLYFSTTDAGKYAETETTTTRLKGGAKPSTKPAPINNIKDQYDADVTYRENSKVNTLGGRGEYALTPNLTLGADFNWFKEERDGTYRGAFHPSNYLMGGNKLPVFDVPVRSKDDNERLDTAADLTYYANDELDFKLRVYRSYYEKRNTTTLLDYQDFGYSSEALSASNGMNANVDIRSYELSSNWQVNSRHLLTAGVEIRDEVRDATVFSQTPGMDRREVNSKAVYLQDDFDLGESWHLTLGGRYDRYSQAGYIDANNQKRDSKTDSHSTFRAGILKNITPLLNVRFNVAQGYRVPDIREQFIQKQTPVGLQLGAQAINTAQGKTAYDLKAEKTMSYELGANGTADKFAYSAVLFLNNIKDKIQQVTIAGNASDYFTFQNVDDAQTYGSELNLSYQLTDTLSSKLFWTELHTEDKKTGKSLEFNPDRVVSIGLDWQTSARLNIGVHATYTGEQDYTKNNQAHKTNDFTLTNLTAQYKLGEHQQFDLFGGINNLFNESVDKNLGSNVGTYYFAGLRANF